MKLPVCLFVLGAAALTTAAPAAPPVSAYMNFAQIEDLKISPNGKLLALTKRSEKLETITVLRYPEASVVTHKHLGELAEIERFEWASDSRLLIQPARRFPGMAYKVPTGEIVGLDADGSKVDTLFGFMAGKMQTGSMVQQRESSNLWARIVDMLPDDPKSVLIQTRNYEREGGSGSVQRMDVKTGRLSRIAGSPVEEANFITDSRHQLTFVWGVNRKGERQTWKFKPEDQRWELVASSGASDGRIFPFEVTPNPEEFIALDSEKSPLDSVVVWNLKTRESRLLFKSDVADVSPDGVDDRNHVWVYRYDDHYPEYWYPDPEHPLARAHRLLRSTFKDANVDFTSWTHDQSLVVAKVSAPRIPPMFYLVDVKQLKVVQQLPAYPDLKREDLSITDPFEVKVRDGVKIRGYLTTPNGTTGKKLPMIVLVHGGPHGIYDRYDFDPEVQLLASRGYAVMQVNFRGSGGRGREFLLSGYGRWGREMQDDLVDTVKWATAAGIADRNRICIYGASYGGYAALTGAFRDPELFKCAVGVAGVYDLPLLFEKGDVQEMARDVAYLRAAVGTDMEELRKRSPVYNADKIKIPVMLIHGKDDERAPFEHARRLRAALQKAGNAPEWISETGEAHGLSNEANRAEDYEKMLAFFAKHIGSAPAP
jgi:dipeptidyl aminopeptidase/acylaminoacyl peptidase